MDVNSDILSFTSVTTEETEDVERIDAATPSFAISMMLGGGGGVAFPRRFLFAATTSSIFAAMILYSSEG